jgi:hypothetical protein
VKYNLMRMPVLPALYDKVDPATTTIRMNPFKFKAGLELDAAKATARRVLISDLMKSVMMQPQAELQACWRAVIASSRKDALTDEMTAVPVSEEEALNMAGTQWDDQVFRAKKTTQWVNEALEKYARVRKEALASPKKP